MAGDRQRQAPGDATIDATGNAIARAMDAGYLLLETRPEQPGIVWARAQQDAPQAAASDLRFAARFADIDAALMHFHQQVRRQLRSLEPRSYAVDLAEAVAAVDAIELDHRRVYIDPSLPRMDAIDARIEELHRRHQRKNWMLQAVGIIAVVFVVAWGLLT